MLLLYLNPLKETYRLEQGVATLGTLEQLLWGVKCIAQGHNSIYDLIPATLWLPAHFPADFFTIRPGI